MRYKYKKFKILKFYHIMIPKQIQIKNLEIMFLNYKFNQLFLNLEFQILIELKSFHILKEENNI